MKRGSGIALIALLVCLACQGPLQAGVYDTESHLVVDLRWPFAKFQQVLSDIRAIPLERPEPDSEYAKMHRRVAEWENRQRNGGLSSDELINLSAAYVRLNRPDDAVALLEPAAREKPNFMLLANLATAHQLAGRLERALPYQKQMLSVWPTLWPGYTGAELHWLRRVEKLHLILMQSRYQEKLRPSAMAVETVDPLFPKVHFVGPSGQYEPGELALEQMDELPIDAVPLVGQLVIWLPHDSRLYWLLGEVFNARGGAYPAYKILEELMVGRSFSPPELRDHRRVLMSVRAIAELLASDRRGLVLEKLLWSLAPREGTLAPGVSGMANETAWIVALFHMSGESNLELTPSASTPMTETPRNPPAAGVEPLQWRQIGVGFFVGVVAGGLVLLQLRSLASRKRKPT